LSLAKFALFKKTPTITGPYSSEQDLASVLLFLLNGRVCVEAENGKCSVRRSRKLRVSPSRKCPLFGLDPIGVVLVASEPSTMLLVGSGLLGLSGYRKKESLKTRGLVGRDGKR